MIKLTTEQMIKLAEKIPYHTYELTDECSGPVYVGQIKHVRISVGQYIQEGIESAFIRCESEGQFLGYDNLRADTSPNPILNLYQSIHEAVDPVLVERRALEQRITQELTALLKED